MNRPRQGGFTLIEVVVAFAIFALCVGALLETFSDALRRDARARDAEMAASIAQSVLSQLRATPTPWQTHDGGRWPDGWVWDLDVLPFEAGSDPSSPWRARQVTVRVGRESGVAHSVQLQSIELEKIAQ